VRIFVKGQDLDISKELSTYIRFRVRFNMGRFADRIKKVTVQLSRERSLQTHSMKCSISTTMEGGSGLVAAQTGDVLTAIDRAVDQMRRAVKRHSNQYYV
jgi:ribosomal subunit interface protein